MANILAPGQAVKVRSTGATGKVKAWYPAEDEYRIEHPDGRSGYYENGDLVPIKG